MNSLDMTPFEGQVTEESQQAVMDASLDVTAPAVVQVSWSKDGKRLWVNIDGVLAFRACRIGELHVDDKRIK